jgi:hypothetical protein
MPEFQCLAKAVDFQLKSQSIRAFPPEGWPKKLQA